MALESYEGKKVVITTVSGQIFSGIAVDYTDPDDNVDEYEGIASICIGDYEIFENEIVKIEVIE